MTSPTLNLCVNPYSQTSLTMRTIEAFNGGRFELKLDTATSFILDSRDYLYFHFTDFLLSLPQNLTFSVVTRSLATGLPVLPSVRLAFRICASTLETECSLTEQ